MKCNPISIIILAAVISAGSFAGVEIQAPPLTAVIGASGDEIRLIEGKLQKREILRFIGIMLTSQSIKKLAKAVWTTKGKCGKNGYEVAVELHD